MILTTMVEQNMNATTNRVNLAVAGLYTNMPMGAVARGPACAKLRMQKMRARCSEGLFQEKGLLA